MGATADHGPRSPRDAARATVAAIAGVPAKVKPKLRGVSHEAAFFVSLVAGPALVLAAPSGSARWLVGVYAVCLSALFGVSALFHRVTWAPAPRLRMRRLDHSMIYVFIAGTYTAIVGLAVQGGIAKVLLGLVWAGAVAGVVVKLWWRSAPRWVGAALYIVLGWVAVLGLPALLAAFGPVGFGLILTGGIAYTVGAIIFARRSPDPVPTIFGYHEVFHAFVVVAAVCHYVAVAGWALPLAR